MTGYFMSVNIDDDAIAYIWNVKKEVKMICLDSICFTDELETQV